MHLIHALFDIHLEKGYLNGAVLTTQNMIFGVNDYLKLQNAIHLYYISHILPANVKLVVWTL